MEVGLDCDRRSGVGTLLAEAPLPEPDKALTVSTRPEATSYQETNRGGKRVTKMSRSRLFGRRRLTVVLLALAAIVISAVFGAARSAGGEPGQAGQHGAADDFGN